VDAYRFNVYSKASGIQTTTGATLSASTVLATIDAAALALDEYEVPADGRFTAEEYQIATISRMTGPRASRPSFRAILKTIRRMRRGGDITNYVNRGIRNFQIEINMLDIIVILTGSG
jgi:hypothetical protein